MDVADHGLDVQQQEDPEDDQDDLGDQVEHGEGQVEDARLLDPDHVHHRQHQDQDHSRKFVVDACAQEVKDGKDRQVGDRRVGGDGDGGRVVEELDPTHHETRGLVECPARE